MFAKLEANVEEYIRNYYRLLDMEICVPSDSCELLKAVFKDRDKVILSNSRAVRAFCRIFGIKKAVLEDSRKQALVALAMDEAFSILHQKGVACFFYNRIAGNENIPHSDLAERRIKKKLSFPKMCQNIQLYENDFKEIMGGKYSIDYVEQISQIPQIVYKGAEFVHEDFKNDVITVINGKRVTINSPQNYSKTIHVFGRCGVFGYAVDDFDTMPSKLQKYLKEAGYAEYRVVNHGLWGADDYCIHYNLLQELDNFAKGDIILFYMKHYDMRIMKKFVSKGVYYKDISNLYNKTDAAFYSLYDKPGHMGSDGYETVAKLILDDLIEKNFGSPEHCLNLNLERFYINCMLTSHNDSKMEREIKAYIDEVNRLYPQKKSDLKCGAIVMNCNPFTYGHRYLIEYAHNRVDRLYIFVVEENKSQFLFSDRFQMVQEATCDLGNIVVVPSGNFMISALTFPEYFMKDYMQEKKVDASFDVMLFGKYIAPAFNIKIRFAGEEPIDMVTRSYNEKMKTILPQYGVEFEEIPRLYQPEIGVISATKVRELMKRKDVEELKKYIPSSTLNILMGKYM